ncbi:MAG: hypothetical protein JJE29_05155 [Peptostreptococcaceae bacterium]|nr:hypothetical protein [Peptostreptococcaceae bacterium]
MLSILFQNGIMIDNLSIFFAATIILVSIPILIYSLGYLKEYKGTYSVGYNLIMTLVFIVSMVLVVISKDSMTFIVFWEVMSVSSFFLVIYEYKNQMNINSGIMYLIMTHISGFFLMAMFAFLYKYTGSMDFNEIGQFSYKITEHGVAVIFILALIGFGAKAGFVPLHAWLPKAHPCAPSNASALMSGVMLKVALYGLIRVLYFFVDGLPLNLSLVLCVIGAVTAIFSILNALVQKDIKKLLAYSSAENIGMILATIGLSFVFKHYGLNSLSLLSLVAALFHILNHAVFKSLLFASAGSVLFATGTKNMNELGGLYGKMKFATIAAFIGTLSISAIPPLNGFASEMLILKSFILGVSKVPDSWVAGILMISGAIIALTGGGALYAAIKSFGITYLGSPRSAKAESIHKIPMTMKIGMGILAAQCVLFGVFSPLIVNSLLHSMSILYIGTDINIPIIAVNYEISIVAGILLTTFLIVKPLVKARKGTISYGDTWGCGFVNQTGRMQYTANALSQPQTRLFAKVQGYSKRVKVTSLIYIDDQVYDVFEKKAYIPIVRFTNYLAGKIVRIHLGKVRVYVLYIFIALGATLLGVYRFG